MGHYYETGTGKKMDGGTIHKIAEQAHAASASVPVPVGYAVAGTIGTTPIWIQDLSGYLEFFAVVFAVLVGATTLYINLLNILEKLEKRKQRRAKSGETD